MKIPIVLGLTCILLNHSMTAANTCAYEAPYVGVIESIATGQQTTKISLGHVEVINPEPLLSSESAHIDAYNSLAIAYKNGAYRVPEKFKRTVSADKESKKHIGQVLEFARSSIDGSNLHKGDIVIVGPPGSTLCTSYGFTGFFNSNGKIFTSLSSANITYGADSLKVSSGKDFSCVKGAGQFDATICKRELTYLVNKISFVLKPNESRELTEGRFSRIKLIESTNSIPPPNVMGGGFGSSMLHGVDFNPK